MKRLFMMALVILFGAMSNLTHAAVAVPAPLAPHDNRPAYTACKDELYRVFARDAVLVGQAENIVAARNEAYTAMQSALENILSVEDVSYRLVGNSPQHGPSFARLPQEMKSLWEEVRSFWCHAILRFDALSNTDSVEDTFVHTGLSQHALANENFQLTSVYNPASHSMIMHGTFGDAYYSVYKSFINLALARGWFNVGVNFLLALTTATEGDYKDLLKQDLLDSANAFNNNLFTLIVRNERTRRAFVEVYRDTDFFDRKYARERASLLPCFRPVRGLDYFNHSVVPTFGAPRPGRFEGSLSMLKEAFLYAAPMLAAAGVTALASYIYKYNIAIHD